MKVLISSLLILFSLIVAIPAIAAPRENSINLQERKEEQIENRIELRQEAKERIASKVAELKQVHRERIRQYFSTVISRNEAAIARIYKLIERMEARIAWIEANDKEISTTVAKSDIAKAKTLLSSAETKLAQLKVDFENSLNSDNPKEEFPSIREDVKAIKADIVAAHQLLVHALGDIKGQRVGATENE